MPVPPAEGIFIRVYTGDRTFQLRVVSYEWAQEELKKVREQFLLSDVAYLCHDGKSGAILFKAHVQLIEVVTYPPKE